MKICRICSQSYSDNDEFCLLDGARLVAQGTEAEAQLAAGLSNRFRIIRTLGAGGMGSVFLAEQIAVGNRPVALKVLSRKLLDDPAFLLRFQNEAASTGRIHHPNVVTVHESGQADDGTPYIAMEYLEGESLRQSLSRRGALPVPEVAEILQQAARGLNAAHKLAIIHRDLKPDNIFLTRGDEDATIVKVVDFGIAKLREAGTHTQTGMVLGTPAYMSYEQACGMRSDELDARSDVYSLGVVVYEMLTGRVPFDSDTPIGYLRKHMMDQPPAFRSVKPELAAMPQLEPVVMKALEKSREARYGSVVAFGRAFAEAAQVPRSVDTGTPPPPINVARPSGVQSGKRVAIAVPPPAAIPAPPKPQPPPPAVPVPVPMATSRGTRKSGIALWVGVPLVAFVLGLGGWYVSSAMHQSSGSPTSSSPQTSTPSTNPPAQNPPAGGGTSPAGAGQQTPAVGTPAGSTGSAESLPITRVEAAKRQGDKYFENGDYVNAINAYTAGLRLAPRNAQLRQALRRAQIAQAAERKFNQ